MSGHVDAKGGNIDENWDDWREHLVDDFGNDLSGLGEIHFWQPYPKKIERSGKMKDKNGIEICCENCDDFVPVGTNDRGCMLCEEDCESVFETKRCTFRASTKALKARIAELQAQAFTIEQLDLIRNIFRVFVDENERMDGDDNSDAREIIAKCDAILKRKSWKND